MRVLTALIGIATLTATAQADFVRSGHARLHGEALHEANVRLYDTLVERRDHNVQAFDHAHPFYGKLLSNDSFFNQIDARWHKAEARFEFYHPLLWRVLDGGEASHQHHSLIPIITPSKLPTPTGQITTTQTVGPPINPWPHPTIPGSPTPTSPPPDTPPDHPKPPGPPNGPPTAPTPEPTSLVLGLLGAAGLASTSVRRFVRRNRRSA
jgi:hypothetical protein